MITGILTMATLVGVTLALLVGLMATFTGLDRGRTFYTTVTMVVATYYILFAAMGGSTATLLVECALAAVFVIAALAGFKWSTWLVVAALGGHGVFDFLVHPHVVSNAGMPPWWPDFCGSYDVVAAIYLGALLMRPVLSAAWARRHTDASSAGREQASGSSALAQVSATRGPTSMLITRSS